MNPEQAKLIAYYRKYRPYSFQDYVKNAVQVIADRISLEGYPKGHDIDVRRIYANKWATLSRNANSGFVISVVYYIASREDLDMTTAIGIQLLKGLFGKSIGHPMARSAFSTKGRTASDVSPDFERLPDIIEKYKAWALEKHKQFQYRRLCNRDLAYEIYQKHRELEKVEKTVPSKIRKVEKKTA